MYILVAFDGIQILAPPFAGQVNLSKLLNQTVPQLSFLLNGFNSIYLTKLWWGLKEYFNVSYDKSVWYTVFNKC